MTATNTSARPTLPVAIEGGGALPTPNPSFRIITVVALLSAGVLAGTQLGKIAPVVAWYQDTLGFSLVMVGWLVAAIGFFVALVALPAGWAIERLGLRRSYIASVTVMIVGGILLAFARTAGLVIAARLIEGAGYLVLVIVVPALLNAIPTPAWRGPSLAIWGGFVPVGFAVGDFLAKGMDATVNARAFLLTSTAVFAVFGISSAVLAAMLPNAPDGPQSLPSNGSPPRGGLKATLVPSILLIGLAFGLYVILSVGFFSFLPTYEHVDGANLVISAGTIALSVPIGNIVAGIAIRAGGRRMPMLLALVGFCISAASAIPAFGGGSYTTAACLAFAVSGGLTASALFAAIPGEVARTGSAAVAIGLVCQAGGIGTVVGPPLAAKMIENGGWTGYGLFLLSVAALGGLTILPLTIGGKLRAQG